jgi:hypothetical protein
MKTIAAACGLAMMIGFGATGAQSATLLGEAHRMGQDTVRSYVDVDAAGAPTAIGILFGGSALRGLPPERNTTSRCFDLNDNGKIDDKTECEGDLEFKLTLPDSVPGRSDIPFRWIGLNWNAEGHPPEPWSVPHFDFHFYIASMNEIALIRVGGCKFFINCEDRKHALVPVPAKYVAEDHINVEATVSEMGNHLIDARTPEFAKPPQREFTHTWIFGANGGHITFYEPMITMAYFMSRPDMCAPIRQPSAWETAGYYPTKYCIRYHRDRDAYTVSLEDLVKRAAD